MNQDPIVIVSIARTPQGNLLGELKDLTAPQLGSATIAACLKRANLSPNEIDEVLMGCVLPAGLGQAPARQATLGASLPVSTGATTINKMCGSGMKSVMLGHDILLGGSQNIIVAGGMESMTNGPYLIPKARAGYRLGHGEIFDHSMLDGLEDAYDKGRPMGYFAETCAQQFGFTRKEQDDFAIESFERARKSQDFFKHEITPLQQKIKDQTITIDSDERPRSIHLEKIASLKPVFAKDGTVTAGNASSISDGAASLILMKLSEANKRGLKPLAKILGFTTKAKKPEEFTTAPIDATQDILQKMNLSVKDIDLFEINEAFAVVALAAMKELNIPHEKLNIHGGGCALGHPIGATGARILVTLISSLQQHNLKRGLASLCIGGGEATAMVVER